MRVSLTSLLFSCTAIAAITLITGRAEAQNFEFYSNVASPTLTSGTSTISFTNGGSTVTDGTPSAVVLADLSEFTPKDTGPNTFANDPYSINFTLEDLETNSSQSGTLTGQIAGTASGGSEAIDPTVSLTNVNTGPEFLTFNFPNGTYSVSRTTFVSPGASGAADGSMGGFVRFSPTASVSSVPEPSSWVPLGLGACAIGGLMLIRRRRVSVV